ncbi:MAG: S8 family serine peptidase [Bacteriovoracaceae bacterium]
MKSHILIFLINLVCSYTWANPSEFRFLFSHQESTSADKELIQTIRKIQLASFEGGNVSGGGDDVIPFKAVSSDSKAISEIISYQLSLLHLPKFSKGPQGRIAIIDTGIMPDSKAAKNVVCFKDFTSTCLKQESCDESKHGSLIADLILQVSPSAQLVVLKALQTKEKGNIDSFLKALKWVVRNHKRMNIKVLNLSLTSPEQLHGQWNKVDKAKELIHEIASNNIKIVVAAGNNYANSISDFPASSPDVITVGSYDHFFSNNQSDFSPSPFSNFGLAAEPKVKHFHFLGLESVNRDFNSLIFKPNYLAPGSHLLACADECYFVTGTSFATALVSGGLLQLQEENLELNNESCDLPMVAASNIRSEQACAINFSSTRKSPNKN